MSLLRDKNIVSHDMRLCYMGVTLPYDMDRVTTLHSGGCSNRKEFFLHANRLEIDLSRILF